MNYLALYKGPAKGLSATLFHWGVRVWTNSKYSHCEIVIDEVCYSSSSRDGGVRTKRINLNDGKWDLIELPNLDVEYVKKFYELTKDNKYDYLALINFVVRLFPQSDVRWICSEWCGRAQRLAGAHKLHIQDLADQALDVY